MDKKGTTRENFIMDQKRQNMMYRPPSAPAKIHTIIPSSKGTNLSELSNYSQNVLERAGPNYFQAKKPMNYQLRAELSEVGPALPKTMVAPIVVDPPYMNVPPEYTYATNDQVVTAKMQFRNLTEDDFECKPSCSKENFRSDNRRVRENFQTNEYQSINKKGNLIKVIDSDFRQDLDASTTGMNTDNQDPFYKTAKDLAGFDKDYTVSEMACGYNPEKLKYGIPVNFPAGPEMLSDRYKDYNKKMFTNRYGSVVYFNEVQDPNFLSNLQSDHYSHGQVTSQKIGTDEFVVKHDPNFVGQQKPIEDPFSERPHMSNIFDGRTIGMGQEYRSYINPVTGTVNYMYDDIDTGSRGFNYISRNAIDTLEEAEQTGILSEESYGNQIHKIAHDAFIDRTNDYRNSMIEGYITEMNTIETQRKMYPVQSYFGRR